MAKNRYEVKYSHSLCHPETCSCLGDYKVFDKKFNCYIEYNDNKEYLIKKYITNEYNTGKRRIKKKQ